MNLHGLRVLALVALSGCASRAQFRGAYSPDRAVTVGAVLDGQASYYSDSLSGNSTANGETYDPSELTAAHRTLPFGTRVRVERVDNGRQVEVRVNDRGPFGHARRIIDLSRAAAAALNMLRAGVVEVQLEVLSVPRPRVSRR